MANDLDLRSLIAETLAAHRDRFANDGWSRTVHCSCGDWEFTRTPLTVERAAAEHRLHRADAILAALGVPVDTEATP